MAMVAQPISPRALTFNSASPPEEKRGFSQLDEHVLAGTGGVVFVRAGSSTAARALEGHLARRATSLGWLPFISRGAGGGPLWREVGSVLGLGSVNCNPRQCAEEIAEAAAARKVMVVAPLPKGGTWARSVAAELSAMPSPLTIFLAYDPDETAPDLHTEAFELEAALDADGKRRWWAAAAQEAFTGVEADDLTTLDAWWTGLRSAPAAGDTRGLDIDPVEGAKTLFQALALAARAWPATEVGRLGANAEALEELVRVGAAQVVRGWVTLKAWHEGVAASADASAPDETIRAVAEVLVERFEEDPWALARGAELLIRAKAFDAADAAHTRAIACADDALVRDELMARWFEVVASAPADAQLVLRCRAAERALNAGEAEEAYQWAQSAAALASHDVSVTLLFGRAAVSLGDFLAARVAFESQRGATDDHELQARVSVELAEVAFGLSDMATAVREAETAIATAQGVVTKLDARNTLGKILIANAQWDEAERHFAEDAWTASSNGLVTEALRAQVNRGIALFSKGLLNEARAIFERVLAAGESIGDTRASAYALDNLAVVAIRAHDYPTALGLMERTLKLRQRLGDRVSIARVLTNLAELRWRLGLFAHAEHALAFGRRVFGPCMPPSRSAHIGIVTARVALARGNTVAADHAITRAIVDSEAANVRNYVGEAYRVAARVALEQGDLSRAREMVRWARGHATTDLAAAEVGLLDGLIARASGETDDKAAAAALALAHAAGDEELLIESHTLLCNVHRTNGDLDAARNHLGQAILLRDQVARPLGEDVRTAFLARPSIAALTDLQPALCDTKSPSNESATARSERQAWVETEHAWSNKMIGDDPAIRALRVAIGRIARSNSTILIRGESGTGKELVADAIHRASERSGGPLVSVNCAALVENLLLSELFGHEKGAFTGASSRRRGRFEMAEGGTLFLDEIGDISSRTQVALLRVLQEKTFERVGGNSPIRADVRIVCATHRDLKTMVDRGDFREDLYYRLRGITLEVPPLRQRLGDLPRLGAHLLARIADERQESRKILTADALDLLARHDWPGNVRELENVLRAASLFAEDDEITAECIVENVDDLRTASLGRTQKGEAIDEENEDDDGPYVPPSGAAPPMASAASAYAQIRQGMSLSGVKRQIERDCIARALAETKGNITRAALLLGMKRPRLSQLVKQYGLAAYFSEAL